MADFLDTVYPKLHGRTQRGTGGLDPPIRGKSHMVNGFNRATGTDPSREANGPLKLVAKKR